MRHGLIHALTAFTLTCPIAASATTLSGPAAAAKVSAHLKQMEAQARSRTALPEIQLQRVTGTAASWLQHAGSVTVKTCGTVTRYTLTGPASREHGTDGNVVTVARRPNGNLYARTRALHYKDDQRAEIGQNGIATFLNGNGSIAAKPFGVLRSYLETGVAGARVTVQNEGNTIGVTQTVHLEALGSGAASYFKKQLLGFPAPPSIP